MAAAPINDRIAKKSEPGILHRLNIAFRNIANAQRDEVGAALPWTDGKDILSSPLAERLHLLIEDVKNADPPPDALFLLEAARPSKSMSWTDMAAQIERETGLTYIGVAHLNGSALPFGKALFINRKTTAVRKFNQLWVSDTPELPSGDSFRHRRPRSPSLSCPRGSHRGRSCSQMHGVARSHGSLVAPGFCVVGSQSR